MTQLGAQMFTVRAFTQTESDLLSTFRKLRAIGYEAVQISAIGAGIPVPAVAAGLKETGLACAATHISFDDCKKDLAAVVEKHRAWGCEYVGVGSMPEEYRADAAGFARFAREASDVADALAKEGLHPELGGSDDYLRREKELLTAKGLDADLVDKVQKFACTHAEKETDRATYQAMEALIHNLNTMHSRAGAQIPFSSINYGMDTSPEGRMVMRNVLLATEAGLGNGETPIFPIQIFRVKEGINYNPGEPNYDLFKLACRVSAKRLFPNFSFQDAPFNLKYYDPARPETQIAYMGCRTRVIGNVYDPTREICNGRGNLSFTSINLPRLAIKAKGDIEVFFEDLDRKMDLVIDQLNERFEIMANKTMACGSTPRSWAWTSRCARSSSTAP